MLLIRSTLFNVAFYLNLVLFFFGSAFAFLMPARPGFVVVRAWARVSTFLLRVIAGTRSEIRGRENIPDGGVLIAAKHQSMWETFALIPLLGYPSYILKRELTLIPFFGWYALKFRMIAVDRGKRSQALKALIARAREELADDRPILIFPEGTRRPPGAVGHYKIGVARLYADCNVPCVPLALNSGLYWPRRKWQRYPGTIRAEFLEPIAPGLSVDAFLRTLEERLEPATQRLLAEAAADPNPPPLAMPNPGPEAA